eukprot:s637_g46.t1
MFQSLASATNALIWQLQRTQAFSHGQMAEGPKEAETSTSSSTSGSVDYGDAEEDKTETDEAKVPKAETAEPTGTSSAGDRAPQGGEVKPEEQSGDQWPWMPERVVKALNKSKSLDEFRSNRPFRYLHLFSGQSDQLATSIKRAAKRNRLEVYVESLDRKRDKEINLASPDTFSEIGKSMDEGCWDGYHSGFPCSSFSRVRWRDSEHGAPPVRSHDHIYGLPGNTPQQQQEADSGTLMAAMSADLHRRQVMSCRRRKIPEASTLENPPGAANTGSAWDLPEVMQALEDTGSSSAEFNTCAYQSQLRQRWFKPARWSGKLETIGSLAKVCKCPRWVSHVPLSGKDATEAAGTDAVAAKIIETWKRVLNLEWLRHQMATKSSQVSELRVKWLDNEEKRRKRIYEGEPVKAMSITQEKKAKLTEAKFLESKPEEKEELPSSSAGPSKRKVREDQNEFAIGGMRNPAVAVSRLHQVRRVGDQIQQAWMAFAHNNPEAIDVARNYGSREAKIDKEILRRWTRRLEEILDVRASDGITLKEGVEFQSPLNSELWDAWRALEEKMDMTELAGLRNYESVEGQKEEAAIEIDRYIEKGFCKVLPLEDIHKRFPSGTASRLALILKQKPDGSTKRRIVIDLRRSQGNARATVEERIIVPRAQDIVSSLRVMYAREHELREEGTSRSVLRTSKEFERSEIEFFLVDLADAFCHFGIHPDELKHCISPGLENGTGIVWCAMLFGYKAAPLVMSRLSAAIGRLVQSTFHPASGQCQIYIDDLALLIRGTLEERNVELAKVLYLLAAFGVQVATHKGERGKRVQWIGTTFELSTHYVTLGAPEKMVREIKETLADWEKRGMIPTRALRSFVGRLSWIAGIIPRIRWTVTVMYAVLTAALKEEETEPERAKKRTGDQRSKIGLVATKRLGITVPWLRTLFEKPELLLIRQEALEEKPPSWGVVTDASRKGIGGILIHKTKQGEWLPIEAFEAPVLPWQATALDIEYGEASGQGVLEGLAVLRALQVWETKLARQAVVIRSDSSVALAMTKKLASPNKTLNYLASETAALMEHGSLTKLIPQHIAGS